MKHSLSLKVWFRSLCPIIFTLFNICCQQKENKQNNSLLEKKKDSISADFRIALPSKIINVPPNILTQHTVASRGKYLDTNTRELKLKMVLSGFTTTLCVPGTGKFKRPVVVFQTPDTILAAAPERIEAKDPLYAEYNPYNFCAFKSDQGLVNNMVSGFFEDSRGNFWISTFEGLSRYDGTYFYNYGKKQGLLSKTIYEIEEDKNGDLWFAGQSGISRFDGTYFYNYDTIPGFDFDQIYSVKRDKSGDLWFGAVNTSMSHKNGLCRFDGKKFFLYATEQGMPGNSIEDLYVDKKGMLWITYYNGSLSSYDGTGFTVYPRFTPEYTIQNVVVNSAIKNLITDRNGKTWMATADGIYMMISDTIYMVPAEKEQTECVALSENGDIWFGNRWGCIRISGKKVNHITTHNGLMKGQYVNTLYKDLRGNLWIGTGGDGAVLYRGNNFTYLTSADGLIRDRILSVYNDSPGSYWFGAYAGGISRLKEGRIETIFTSEFPILNSVWNITGTKDSTIVFLGLDGLMEYDGSRFKLFNGKKKFDPHDVMNLYFPVNKYYENRKYGRMALGLWSGIGIIQGDSIIQYDDNDGLFGRWLNAIAFDAFGGDWFSVKDFNIHKVGLFKVIGSRVIKYDKNDGFTNGSISTMIKANNGDLWIGTDNDGLFRYDGKSFIQYTSHDGLSDNSIQSLLQDRTGNIWIGTKKGLNKIATSFLPKEKIHFTKYQTPEGFLGKACVEGSLYEDMNGDIWIGTDDRLAIYHPSTAIKDDIPPVMQLLSIKINENNFSWKDFVYSKDAEYNALRNTFSDIHFDSLTHWSDYPVNLSLPHNKNTITFSYAGATTKYPRFVTYETKLEGFSSVWSLPSSKTETTFGNLPAGKYIFRVRSISNLGLYSNEVHYKFEIKPPFWSTWWFRLGLLLLTVMVLRLYVKQREKKLKQKNHELEELVYKRTSQIREQKTIIEEKHKEISDSINYAERIQRSFLASKDLLDQYLHNYFLLFKPKEAVSGDFYWASALHNGNFAIVTADSTGHGVPGAIMSILNTTCLENAIKEKLTEPKEIFNYTRTHIIERLKKDGSSEGGMDGMDASILVLTPDKRKICFTGAHNPVWIIREGQLLELEPDKMPVGRHDKDKNSFTQLEFALNAGDMIYTLTDGYADQFGGPKGKKFMYKRLKDLLLNIASFDLKDQEHTLRQELASWMSNAEQVDDITIIGIKI
ncbi:two-component regulator propeller domain-containing protein [Aurantibacillus circumpalustris]|uniref:two-component regulator propeller domain-containing protein n=1 Tax=Aurantibacillus circumpalustris TaxID=3036359 RepID=UPI00295C2D92|nr:two-component regulator propeller domain-containing protein [Aurantibacillus circumpalustris]